MLLKQLFQSWHWGFLTNAMFHHRETIKVRKNAKIGNQIKFVYYVYTYSFYPRYTPVLNSLPASIAKASNLLFSRWDFSTITFFNHNMARLLVNDGWCYVGWEFIPSGRYGSWLDSTWRNEKSEYDQEIHVPQSQTTDKPVASWGRATQQSWDTRKTNKAKQPALSSPSRWLQN